MRAMGKNNIAKTSVCLFFIFLVLLFSTIAYAADVPSNGPFFYGTAIVNGRNVPVDSIVLSKIEGGKRGEIRVDVAGEYGRESGDSKLPTPGTTGDVGKKIEFYVKLPGIEEIKAEETYVWQPISADVSIVNLNLTFMGEEVQEPVTTTQGGGGGGGGSGGGSAGGGGAAQQSGLLFYYNLIEAGKQISISISDDILTRLQLILNNNVEDVNFEFEVFDSTNVPKLDGTYKYISINAPKITEDNVKTAILKFKIKNEWFEKNNYEPKKVVLLRYEQSWEELETVHEGSDSTHNYYRAGVPGFSYFAIKSEKAEAALEEGKETKEIFEDTGEKIKEGLSEITGRVIVAGAANPVVGFAIILIIIIVGVSIYFFVTKK